MPHIDREPSVEGPVEKENVLALLLGFVQVFFAMTNEWIAMSLGYHRIAGLGVLGVVAFGGAWSIYRASPKNLNSFATLGGLSVVAFLLLIFMGNNTSATDEQVQPLQLKSVVGEIFLDLNRNGFRDGADQPIQGIDVTLRDRLGRSQTFASDARGLVRFDIPADRYQIQIRACGVAQSHRLTSRTEIAQPPSSGGLDAPVIYKIDIGIESNLENCQ